MDSLRDIQRQGGQSREDCVLIDSLRIELAEKSAERETMQRNVRFLESENNRLRIRLNKVAQRLEISLLEGAESFGFEESPTRSLTSSQAGTGFSELEQSFRKKESIAELCVPAEDLPDPVELLSQEKFLGPGQYVSIARQYLPPEIVPEARDFLAACGGGPSQETRPVGTETRVDLLGNLMIIEPNSANFRGGSLESEAFRCVASWNPDFWPQLTGPVVKSLIPFESTISRTDLPYCEAKLRELLLDSQASFGWLVFSPPLRPNQVEFNDFLREVNLHKRIYFYFLKLRDFFVEGSFESHMCLSSNEKFVVLATEVPLTYVVRKLLLEFAGQARTRRLQLARLKDPRQLEKVLSLDFKDEEKRLFFEFAEQLAQIKVPKDFGDTLSLRTFGTKIEWTLPGVKAAFLTEIEQLVPAFLHFPLEEILLVLFAVLQEKKVVFVSEKQPDISSAISVCQLLIKPFDWPHPIIYSLPSLLFNLLKIPLPIICGLLLPSIFVREKVIPNSDPFTIFVFLDEKKVHVCAEMSQSLLVPEFDRFLETVSKLFVKKFKTETSHHLRIEKTKTKTSSFLSFHKGTTMTSKLFGVLRYVKPESKNSEVNSEALQSIFFFFRFFFTNFISSKIGGQIPLRMDPPARISLSHFPPSKPDHCFLKLFCSGQLFSSFVHKHYGLNSSLLA